MSLKVVIGISFVLVCLSVFGTLHLAYTDVNHTWNYMKNIEWLIQMWHNENSRKKVGFKSFVDVPPHKHLIHKDCIPTLKKSRTNVTRSVFGPIPGKFDWRERKAIRPVINQNSCSGCWAISIIENMESIAFIRDIDKSLTALSAQQLIDCDRFNNGCIGGDVVKALEYLCQEKMGVTTAEEYPNDFKVHQCAYHGEGRRKITEYWTYFDLDEHEMLRKLYRNGPLVAAVNSAPWPFYMSGVVQNSCVPEIQNHVVQIVGYDVTAVPPFYIIRNSWGTDWGEQGYIRLAFGIGICGINKEVTYFNVMDVY